MLCIVLSLSSYSFLLSRFFSLLFPSRLFSLLLLSLCSPLSCRCLSLSPLFLPARRLNKRSNGSFRKRPISPSLTGMSRRWMDSTLPRYCVARRNSWADFSTQLKPYGYIMNCTPLKSQVRNIHIPPILSFCLLLPSALPLFFSHSFHPSIRLLFSFCLVSQCSCGSVL